MSKPVDVEVWVRGTMDGHRSTLSGIPADAALWTDDDVRRLLSGMLLEIERQKNPGGTPPPVSLRGFSWIVSPDGEGVVVHIEMQMGTASAGPFAIDEATLSGMITRVLATPEMPVASPTVH
ncbi:MAG: hypothetical protein IT177_20110 [Acidobacteria bacterium]|nr:hypothetical protein [Acidobacteriota bacterium]